MLMRNSSSVCARQTCSLGHPDLLRDQESSKGCLDAWTSTETMGDRECNSEDCKDACGEALKSLKIQRRPKAMFLQLKRYSYTNGKLGDKMHHFVSLQSTLDVFPYLTQECGDEMDCAERTYQSQAVTDHEGWDLQSGQCIAHVRRGGQLLTPTSDPRKKSRTVETTALLKHVTGDERSSPQHRFRAS